MSTMSSRWSCLLAVMALLIALAPPAHASGDVGLVTRVSGDATVVFQGLKEASPARDFVTLQVGDRYALPAGASVDLVVFASARRERWRGPASFAVTSAGVSADGPGSPTVTALPASAVKALRRMPPRKASRTARAGASRLRNTAEIAQPFDDTAARRQADALLAVVDASTTQETLSLPALQLTSRLEGGLHTAVAQLAGSMGYEVRSPRSKGAKASLAPGVSVALGPDGALKVSVDGGPTWQLSPRDLEGRHAALLAAARAARLLGLVGLAEGGQAPKTSLSVVAAEGGSAHKEVVRVGELLTFEIASESDAHLFYAFAEIGTTPSVGVVYPASASPVALRPRERHRLPIRFMASPPLGHYQYVMVTTTLPDAWWAGERGDGQTGGIAELLWQLTLGPRPAAPHAATVGTWSATAAKLEVRPER